MTPSLPLASIRRGTLESMLATVRRLGSSADLAEALGEISQAVTEVLAFQGAAVNVVLPSGDIQVVAAMGAAPEGFVGSIGPRSDWDDLMAASEPWGGLLFHSHDRDQAVIGEVPLHVFPLDGSVEPDDWDVRDILLAPLLGDGGELVGVLSVDAPLSGKLPDAEQRTVLELFASQAASAIVDANRRALLGDEERLYRAVFAKTPTPTVILERSLDVLAANDAVARLLRQPAELLERGALGSLVDPIDLPGMATACEEVLAGGPSEASVEHRLRVPGGAPVWVRTQVGQITSAVSGTRLVLTMRDVTEARRTIEELHHLADHDPVTGLPNRVAALDRLGAALDRCQAGQAVVVVVVGIDRAGAPDAARRTRPVAGAAPGLGGDDELLVGVARRLEAVIRPRDHLCRVAPDQLAVIAVLDTMRAAAATSLAERCIEVIRPAFELHRGVERVTISAGVVATADAGVAPAAILSSAGVARREAQRAGGDRWHLGSVGDPRG